MEWLQMHEWYLAARYKDAINEEDYETCKLIKQEIDDRVEGGTINHTLMKGFCDWNPFTQEFEGEPRYSSFGVEGLFDKYHEKYGYSYGEEA